MSFTSETKQTLCALTGTKACCKSAELYGLLAFGNVFEKTRIKYITENRSLAELIVRLLDEEFSVHPNLYRTEKKSKSEYSEEGQYYSYKITVANGSDTKKIYTRFLKENEVSLRIPNDIFLCPHCMEAFLRGTFLSGGMVSDPSDAYHLEITTTHFILSEELLKLLLACDIEAKMIKRNSSYVVYLKKSEAIEHFLVLIGAKKAVFRLMDEKILGDIRNNANRISNCEIANMDKSISASQIQLAAIQKLLDSGKMQLLPEALQTTAKLRMENPSATVKELGEMHSPAVSKSGVVHRLNKLIHLADS